MRPLYRRFDGKSYQIRAISNRKHLRKIQSALTEARSRGINARAITWSNGQVGIYVRQKYNSTGETKKRRDENLRRRRAMRNLGGLERFGLGTEGNRRRRLQIANDRLSKPDDEKWVSGYCHEYAIMLQRANPKLKLRIARGWEYDAIDDDDFFVEHVWVVDELGRATDGTGTYESEQELSKYWGGVDFSQFDGDAYQIDDADENWIKELVESGELKQFCEIRKS